MLNDKEYLIFHWNQGPAKNNKLDPEVTSKTPEGRMCDLKGPGFSFFFFFNKKCFFLIYLIFFIFVIFFHLIFLFFCVFFDFWKFFI